MSYVLSTPVIKGGGKLYECNIKRQVAKNRNLLKMTQKLMDAQAFFVKKKNGYMLS